MNEFCPYYTNDGSVGLFSPSCDDIYHSAYGALTESYEKFILPANLDKLFSEKDNIKVLDICYGIGYNTKSFLNYFINYLEENKKSENIFEKFFKKVKKKFKKLVSPTANIAPIYTDNITELKLREKYIEAEYLYNKLHFCKQNNNEAIYTDNILRNEFKNSACKRMENYLENKIKIISLNKIYKINKNSVEKNLEINSGIFKNPKRRNFLKKISQKIKKDFKISKNQSKQCFSKYSLKIDLLETDDVLIGVSPFISLKTHFKRSKFSYKSQKSLQIQKMLSGKKYKSPYKIKPEVNIVLLKSILKNNPELIYNEKVSKILTEKKYFDFFDELTLKLNEFYQKNGYKYIKKEEKQAFLHNIYYRYISKRSKKADYILKNHLISINSYNNDARKSVLQLSDKYDVIFLDAFTPNICPMLWSEDFFKELFKRLNDDGILLTYSSAVLIRKAFLNAGFLIGKTKDKNNNFVGTIATKNKNNIQYKLDDIELDLLKTKAGITYKDKHLDKTNQEILSDRESEFNESKLISSSKFFKGVCHEKI